jgi:hypothetical protein
MKGLMICILATVEVLGVIYLMGRRRHPRTGPDHIDRAYRKATAEPWYTPHDGPTDGCNCRTIPIAEGTNGAR